MIKRLGAMLCLIFSAVSLPAQTAHELRQAGLVAYREEDLLRAASLLRQALALNPNFREAQEDLAQVFFVLGENVEAERHSREAFRLAGGRGRSSLLLARILASKGAEGLAQAQNLVAETVAREGEGPDVWLALGELETMRGRLPLAARYFAQVVQREPSHFQGLFSLFQIEEHLGGTRRAQALMETLLRTHGAEPEVLYRASDFFHAQGHFVRARQTMERLLELTVNWSYPGTWIRAVQQKARQDILAAASGREHRLEESSRLLKEAHTKDGQRSLTLALLGLVEARLGRYEEAAGFLRQAVERDKDNEILRLVWEATSLELPIGHAFRQQTASFHADLAVQEASRNRFDQVRAAYRRLLTLDPLDRGGRWAFARVWKDLGFPGLYLDGLLTLNEIPTEARAPTQALAEQADRERSRELAYWRDRWYPDYSVAGAWRLDMDTFRRWRDPPSWRLNLPGEGGRPYRVGVFAWHPARKVTVYPEQDRFLLQLFTEKLESHKTPWPRDPRAVGQEGPRAGVLPLEVFPKDPQTGLTDAGLAFLREPEEAVAMARRLGLDYYLILDLQQGEDDFRATAHLHVGATGRLVRTLAVSRSGAGRVAATLRDLVQAVAQVFPLRAPLAAKRVRQGRLLGLVPLGTLHGVRVGDVFAVLKPGVARVSPEFPLAQWSDGDVLSEFIVTKTDDWLSEGELKPVGRNDLTSVGDEVFLRREVPENLPPLPPSLTGLQRGILGIR